MARHLQLALVMVLSFVVPGGTVIAQCNGSLGKPAVVNNAYDTTCPEISQITSFRATGSMACREIGFNVQASEEVSYADEAKGVCSEDPPWICTVHFSIRAGLHERQRKHGDVRGPQGRNSQLWRSDVRTDPSQCLCPRASLAGYFSSVHVVFAPERERSDLLSDQDDE